MRHTREHAEGTGPPHQAREGRASECACLAPTSTRTVAPSQTAARPLADSAESALAPGLPGWDDHSKVASMPVLVVAALAPPRQAATVTCSGQRRRQRIGQNRKRVRSQANQRREPRERDGREIHEQMPTGCRSPLQRFQMAASRSACDQRSPSRSTTSCTQAASPAGPHDTPVPLQALARLETPDAEHAKRPDWRVALCRGVASVPIQ